MMPGLTGLLLKLRERREKRRAEKERIDFERENEKY